MISPSPPQPPPAGPSRLVTRESSDESPSLRVYYSVITGAIPFDWEIQPGTPKRPSTATIADEQRNNLVPKLTPPPSRAPRRSSFPAGGGLPRKAPSSSSSSSILFSGSVLPRLKVLLRRLNRPVPRLTSTSTSTSFESASSGTWSFSSASEDADMGNSPTSVTCFGVGRKGRGKDSSSLQKKQRNSDTSTFK